MITALTYKRTIALYIILVIFSCVYISLRFSTVTEYVEGEQIIKGLYPFSKVIENENLRLLNSLFVLVFLIFISAIICTIIAAQITNKYLRVLLNEFDPQKFLSEFAPIIKRVNSEKYGLVQVLSFIAIAKSYEGKFEESEKIYLQIFSFSLKKRYKKYQALMHANLSVLYYTMGQYEKRYRN